MIILVLLQNQWFNEPERVKEIYQQNPEHRNRFVASFLFMGCLTGKRLQQAWGEDLCDKLIYEEASPEITGQASASPPADLQHIIKAILDVKPDVIVTLGRTATNGLLACTAQWGQGAFTNSEFKIKYCTVVENPDVLTIEEPIVRTEQREFIVLTGPHPTTRANPMPRLKEIGLRLRELIAEEEVLPL